MRFNGIIRKTIMVLALILVTGTMSMVFADTTKPVINFSSSGAIYNKESKLLRFNFILNHPNSEDVTVMYAIDDEKAKKLGKYENKYDSVIAHVYLEGSEIDGSVIYIYAVDSDGNKSEKVSTEFQIASSPGITITDEAVPLSVKEGTWSLINLFLAALSVAMFAISVMIYLDNRSIVGFVKGGKINSIFITIITVLMAGGNVGILLVTQNLKHEMVMVDNMTISMLIITVLSVITTMTLAVRAFGVNSERNMIKSQ